MGICRPDVIFKWIGYITLEITMSMNINLKKFSQQMHFYFNNMTHMTGILKTCLCPNLKLPKLMETAYSEFYKKPVKGS